jgi:hypothetical protein
VRLVLRVFHASSNSILYFEGNTLRKISYTGSKSSLVSVRIHVEDILQHCFLLGGHSFLAD